MVLFTEDDQPAAADPFRARVGLLSLRGRYSITSAREIVRVISPDLAGHEVVIFDFSKTEAMDDNAAMAMEELINGSVLGQDKGCIVAGLSEDSKNRSRPWVSSSGCRRSRSRPIRTKPNGLRRNCCVTDARSSGTLNRALVRRDGVRCLPGG